MGVWEPQFVWVACIAQAAMLINSVHEDFPQRVPATAAAIRAWPLGSTSTGSVTLSVVHRAVFRDLPHAGTFRQVDVRVGRHFAPNWRLVPALMDELGAAYPRIRDIDQLQDYYWDLETLHPFQDGNGRVGGVVVAALSHMLEPEKGYLATPN